MVREGRSDQLRKKHRAIIARSKPACYLCGEPIDYTLRYPDPGCFVVDHVIPIAKGGSDGLANKKAAHHPRMQLQETRTHRRTLRAEIRVTRLAAPRQPAACGPSRLGYPPTARPTQFQKHLNRRRQPQPTREP